MIEVNINNIPENMKDDEYFKEYLYTEYDHLRYVVCDVYRYLLEYIYIPEYRDYTHIAAIIDSVDEIQTFYWAKESADEKCEENEIFSNNIPVIISELKEIFKSVKILIATDAMVVKQHLGIDIDVSNIPEELPKELHLDNLVNGGVYDIINRYLPEGAIEFND